MKDSLGRTITPNRWNTIKRLSQENKLPENLSSKAYRVTLSDLEHEFFGKLDSVQRGEAVMHGLVHMGILQWD